MTGKQTADPPYILGLSSGYRNSAACLLYGNDVVVLHEEGPLRHGATMRSESTSAANEFPLAAIEYGFDVAGIGWEDIASVAFSRDPGIRGTAHRDEGLAKSFALDVNDENEPVPPEQQISAALADLAGEPLADRLVWVPHQIAHSASAYLASPYDDAAVLVLDSMGGSGPTLLGHGAGTSISQITELSYPNSLGLLWGRIAEFLGLGRDGIPQLMELAPYATAGSCAAALGSLLDIRPDGTFETDTRHASFPADDFSDLEEIFGRPSPGLPALAGSREAGIAAALHDTTTKIIMRLARYLTSATGTQNLCLAGDVALSYVANSPHWAAAPFSSFFVQPAVGGAGASLGAALWVLHDRYDWPRRFQMNHPYLGRGHRQEAVDQALDAANLRATSPPDTARITAELIAAGYIVGWYQARPEVGPSALGNRGILADPRQARSKELINSKVKHSDHFRPFASSVLEEQASDWFEIPRDSPSHRFVSCCCEVRPDRQKEIPAVLHVDGTSRVHIVPAAMNKKYHRLITEFYRLTGIPLILNTPFSVDDEPVACSPPDAIRAFVHSDLDALVLENRLVMK